MLTAVRAMEKLSGRSTARCFLPPTASSRSEWRTSRCRQGVLQNHAPPHAAPFAKAAELEARMLSVHESRATPFEREAKFYEIEFPCSVLKPRPTQLN